MPTVTDIVLALSGWAAWLAKEIISALLRHGLSRSGAKGVIEESAAIFCEVQGRDGGTFFISYAPGIGEYPQYADSRRFRAVIRCQFYNDTRTPLIYTNLTIQLWGVEGLRLIHSNPDVEVLDERSQQWIESPSITVPSHAVVRVRFTMPLAFDLKGAEEAIASDYDGAVALLCYKLLNGKEAHLRICTRSFVGEKVVWRRNYKYPVYNLIALNEYGSRSGRRAQQRKRATTNS